MIYLDNAATSFPKPEEVYGACDRALRTAANPGRGGHSLSRASARLILDAREQVADFFAVKDSRRIIFTSGATESLNMVLMGLSYPRKRIIACGFEHNSLWRPLEYLRVSRGIEVLYLDLLNEEGPQWEPYKTALKQGADLVVVTHASNITGNIYPLAEIAQLARQEGTKVCVDASQTAGIIPLDLPALGVDFAAFPGHKGLMGPPGVGVLYVATGVDLTPLRLGGTGGHSESPEAPQTYPERLESGTLNVPGIAGLAAGVSWLKNSQMDIHAHELKLKEQLVGGLRGIGAIVYQFPGETVGVTAFNLPGTDSAEVAHLLDELYSIAVRGGLHCCPRGHAALGTTVQGAVRVSPGVFNTPQDIQQLLSGLRAIKDMMG